MTNKTLLTYGAKVNSVEQVYYSPVAVLPTSLNVKLNSIYCVLSRTDAWEDDNNPPQPTQDQLNIKSMMKNIFVAKLVTSNDISPVVQRIDWTSGVTYDYYRDDIDMFQVDNNDFLIYDFYIKNKYDQVFKCLWNNNGEPSTVEPFFEPGTYGTNNIFLSSDKYKWKYEFTVDTASKVKFMDTRWIPVPALQANVPNPLISSAGYGNIEVINVVNGGAGYDPANAVISIVVTGDGTGAAGTAVVEDGVITDVIVTNTGTNYTFSNVSVSSTIGANAVLIAPTSPIGGHGYDAISELGCSHVMINSQFNGSENGFIPTDIDFFQVGLLVNPIAKSTNPNPANSAIYKTTTDLIVAPGFGVYINDEKVYQGTSLESSSFNGTVLSFDVATNIIKLINTTGTLTTNAPVFGNDSKTARTLLSSSSPDLVTLSGYLTFIQNRSSVQRSADGIEQFKIVIGY